MNVQGDVHVRYIYDSYVTHICRTALFGVSIFLNYVLGMVENQNNKFQQLAPAISILVPVCIYLYIFNITALTLLDIEGVGLKFIGYVARVC